MGHKSVILGTIIHLKGKGAKKSYTWKLLPLRSLLPPGHPLSYWQQRNQDAQSLNLKKTALHYPQPVGFYLHFVVVVKRVIIASTLHDSIRSRVSYKHLDISNTGKNKNNKSNPISHRFSVLRNEEKSEFILLRTQMFFGKDLPMAF